MNFQPIENAFEIFGLDFLVDDDLNLQLLEVNSYPDFKQTGANLKDLINKLFQNIFIQIILPFFNKPIDSDKLIDLVKVFDEPIYGKF